MDSSLLKDYNAFKKRSLAQPAVEARNKEASNEDATKKKKRRYHQELPVQLVQEPKKAPVSSLTTFNYKTAGPIRTKGRFFILSAIVDLLKKRHQDKEFEALTLDELLDMTKNTDIRSKDRQWLESGSLTRNQKVAFVDGKYTFKPKYPLRDKKSLLRLLDKQENTGLGGALLDDIRESLPNADDVVKAVNDRVIFVTRSTDKKAILFSYEPTYSMQVDEEFKKHWRSVAVEGLGEPDIEKYLNNSGITSMQGVTPLKRKAEHGRKRSNKKKNFKSQNVHLGGNVLKDYSG